ncbi:MAG: ATP-binding protein [Methanosarcinales archaeon]|nr:ATP-binding protein [Methanosarcinales archaeon]
MNFIGRKKELESRSERFKSDRAEFLIIYGRRRIGKTELIKKTHLQTTPWYHLDWQARIQEASA